MSMLSMHGAYWIWPVRPSVKRNNIMHLMRLALVREYSHVRFL